METKRPKPEGEKMAKLTAYLEPDFYKAVRVAAIEDGVAVTRLVEQLLKDYLVRRKKKGGRT